MIFVSMFAFSQTQFIDGTEWRTQQTNTADPVTKSHIKISKLDGIINIGNYEALKMYCKYEGEFTWTMDYYIRTENDKIFFMPVDADEWFLMYDFGLKPGQGCYVYSPAIKDNSNMPLKSYVKCVNIEDGNATDFPIMTIEEYKDETCIGKGIWLKGLSSKCGVDYNIGFDMDGIGTSLLEVKRGENIIYSQKTSSISQISDKSIKYSINGHDLTVFGINPSDDIRLYNIEGKLLESFKSEGDMVSVRMHQKGIYILKAGKRKKIVIKL